MSRIISVRHTLVVVFVFLSVTALAATASATKPRTWRLTQEAPKHRAENPRPDRYKHPGVWSWMYGEADTPSSYLLMDNYFNPKVEETECGTEKFYGWSKASDFFGLPAVFYNAGPTVARGDTRCAPFAEYPTKTFFMHPDNASSLASVVRWKSPITGTVIVSGSVQPTDSHVEGIIWQLDQGSTILAGPTEKTDNSVTSFGPITISVVAGESLYLEMTRGVDGGSYDTTAVTLNITS
jgi:hypothetical protein